MARTPEETELRRDYADAINALSKRYKLGRPKVTHADADRNLIRFVDESQIARRIVGQWQPEKHGMSWQDGIKYLEHPSLFWDPKVGGDVAYKRHRAELAAYRARQYQKADDAGAHISDAGVRFITSFEGFEPNWYGDGGPGNVQTISYGHTGPLPPGYTVPIDRAEGLRLFKYDVAAYERAVLRVVKVKVTQPQFDMLVSFVYNGGPGWLSDDYDFAGHINKGDWTFVLKRWPEYRNPGSNVEQGLLRRRNDEVRIIKTGRYTTG